MQQKGFSREVMLQELVIVQSKFDVKLLTEIHMDLQIDSDAIQVAG